MATSSDAAESLSGSCRNLLAPEDFYFNTSTGTWQTTNGTSSVDFSFRYKNQYIEKLYSQGKGFNEKMDGT